MKLNVKNKIVPLIYNDRYYNMWRGTYPETDKEVWLNSHVSFKDKIKYAMARIRIYPNRRSRIIIHDDNL